MADTATMAGPAPLSSMSDEDLLGLAAQHPPLEHMSDEKLAGLAVNQGLLQEDQAVQAVEARKSLQRTTALDAATSSMRPMERLITATVLTKGGKVGDVAAEVLAPIAGAVIGTVAEPGGGTIAGGVAGGVGGESLAQARQYFRGERDKASPGALAAGGIAGGIPMGGRLLKTPARVIATRALQGAGIATTAEAVRQAIDEHRMDFGGLATSGVLGSLFGAGAGSIEAAATRRSVLSAIRKTPEFKDFSGNDRELVNAVRAKLEKEQPAPAEPKNVTPAAEKPVAAEPSPSPAAVQEVESQPGTQLVPATETPTAKPLAELTDAELLQVAKNTPLPGAPGPVPVPDSAAQMRAGPPPAQPATAAPTAQPEVAANGGEAVAPTVAGNGELIPAEPQVTSKGGRLRFAPRPDGTTDIIDAIQDLGGVPKPPAGAKGGEWDGYKGTFQGSARILQRAGESKTGIDQYLQDLAASYPEFAYLEKNADAFYTEVQAALAERGRLKTATSLEQQTGKFMEAALEGKGRPFSEKVAKPVSVDELTIGTRFSIKREPFEVVSISPDDGSVTVKDGPRFGTQILPAGELLHPDKGSFQPATGSDEFLPGENTMTPPGVSRPAGSELFGDETPFNLAGEEQMAPRAPAPIAAVAGELFNAGDVRSTAPTALDKANAAAREGQAPRTAAMGSSAPRPSAGKQRVTAAQAQARATVQQAAGLPAAGTALAKAAPTANAATWFRGARAVFAPQTLDQGAADMAHILRAGFGAEYAAGQRADEALAGFRKEFDRTPVPRTWAYNPAEPLPRNYEVMSRIDSGNLAGLTPTEQGFARVMRAQLDQAVAAVQQVSPHSLRELLENYFPRIWQDPEKNAGKINALLTHRPLEGPKSFLKQRTLQYFTDGLKQGLVPVSDNPVDVTLQKLGEMARFVTARKAMQEARRAGLRKFKYVYEPMPEGWRAVDDPSTDVWKPPTVTVREAFDAQLRAKTIEMLEQLGISHERTTKLGGQRWGQANEQMGIKTKFGGPDFVFWHEAGHMLDWRFPELRDLTGAMERGPKGDQMRKLADLRYEGQEVPKSYKSYVRKTEEKIANMFDAYIRAPEKFQQVAPDVYRDFKGWLAQHPEVQGPLDAIKPSLRLGSGTAEIFAGGPIKLGDWIMPEGAAQVMDNYLQPGLGRYAVFRGLRDVSGLANGAQLLGFFHGQFVMNDSFYSGLGMALYDALNGKPVRAAKELLQTPISPVTSWLRGRQIQKAIRDPNAASATARQIGQMAIEANLRAGHGPNESQFARQWMRAVRESIQSPNVGAIAESFLRAPMAGLELALSPVMKGLVPPMKLGIFGRMATRVLEDNPGATLEQLRAKLAQAADATEDRLGQVTYDNLFQRRVLKDAMQLALRAYGWQLTKYRMIAGGTADWGRAARDAASGKKPNVTFRMSYLPAMVLGHAILGAILQYALTGKMPEKPMDYLFPETGLKDKLGRPVRVALADFVKDVAADWRSFPNLNRMGSEWTHKLAPMWNIAAEMYLNRDFYGTEIFSEKQLGEPEMDHLLKNLGEGVVHLAKSAQPFSLRAGQKFTEAGANPALGYLAPTIGFVQAPRYAIETPMQNYLSEQAGRDQYTRTQEQAAQSQVAKDISAALREHKPLTPEQQKAMRTLSADQRNRAARKAYMDPDVWAMRALSLDQAMQAWDLANDQERQKISPTVRMKIMNAFTSGQDPEKLKRYLMLVNRVPAK